MTQKGLIANVIGAPRVEAFRGKVAVWTQGSTPAEQFGLLLDPGAGVQTALKMLGVVDDLTGDRAPVMPIDRIEAGITELDDRERVGKLIFVTAGKRIPLFVSLEQLAELAVALQQLSIAADDPKA